MAIYEGARPQPRFGLGQPRRTTAPAQTTRRPGRAETATLPRRRTSGAIRARRRSNKVGMVLGAIVVAFLLAFFSLAQTMRVSATGYDVDRLQVQQKQLTAAQRQLVSDINRMGGVSAIRKQAIDAGLSQLTNPLIVTAR